MQVICVASSAHSFSDIMVEISKIMKLKTNETTNRTVESDAMELITHEVIIDLDSSKNYLYR